MAPTWAVPACFYFFRFSFNTDAKVLWSEVTLFRTHNFQKVRLPKLPPAILIRFLNNCLQNLNRNSTETTIVSILGCLTVVRAPHPIVFHFILIFTIVYCGVSRID